MTEKDINTSVQSKNLTPWVPMSNPVDIKYIGKLGEEINEAGKAIFRCIIQGLDGTDPKTFQINKTALEDELADVEANIALVKAHFNLDVKRMSLRMRKKKAFLKEIHNRTSHVTNNVELEKELSTIRKILVKYFPFVVGSFSGLVLLLLGIDT